MDDFYCGADVLAHDNVGGGIGYIVDISGNFITVKMEDGSEDIYHYSDISLMSEEEEDSSFWSLSDTHSYYGVSQKDFF